MTTNVTCFHIYVKGDDRYEGHVDLCDEHKDEYDLSEGHSLHVAGPTNRPCEVCDAHSDEA